MLNKKWSKFQIELEQVRFTLQTSLRRRWNRNCRSFQWVFEILFYLQYVGSYDPNTKKLDKCVFTKVSKFPKYSKSYNLYMDVLLKKIDLSDENWIRYENKLQILLLDELDLKNYGILSRSFRFSSDCQRLQIWNQTWISTRTEWTNFVFT